MRQEGSQQNRGRRHEAPHFLRKKCEDSGFQLIVGDKHYKLDDKGNDMAKEYIEKDDAATKVTIEGKMEDGKITDVTSIKPAEKKEEK